MYALVAVCVVATCFSNPIFAGAEDAAPEVGRFVTVHGKRLWVDLQGNGATTVVFEAGGGSDARVWADLVPQVQALGVRTLVYDRAGLGRSEADPSPYTIDREVAALRAALDQCDVAAPVVIVAHSYGGAIALLTACRDTRVAGLVLLDAVVPGFYTPARLEALLAEYRPQYAAVRAKAPALARTLIPLMEAYPASMATLNQARMPPGLPIMDIAAARPAPRTQADIDGWHAAHAAFAAAGPARIPVFAAESGHQVMADQPDLVRDTLARLLQQLDAARGDD